MPSEKPDKKISYFPRSWGSRRRPGSAKQAAQSRDKQEPKQATARNPELESSSQSGTDASPPVEQQQASLNAHESPCPCSEDCTFPIDSTDCPDSSNDTETLETLDAIVDRETLGWRQEREAAMAKPDSEEGTEGGTELEIARAIVNILGVRFGYAGRIYHFDAGDLVVAPGDWVLVKTEKGLGLGQVAVAPSEREISAAQLEGLRKVIRKATKADFDQKMRCAQRERDAFTYCQETIESLGLPMKLVTTECFFDGSKYVFYFTAEGRVDFRELVKLLVARFPVRIEMRQIGVRHEAKMIGGLACCGEELCCSRFLTDFRPVSVKMAKTQNLSLNPSKISGVCGRLMCCLAYEYDIYEEFRKGLPKVGKKVKTPQGEGVVLKHDPLSETVLVKVDDETTLEFTKDQVVAEETPPPPKRPKKKT